MFRSSSITVIIVVMMGFSLSGDCTIRALVREFAFSATLISSWIPAYLELIGHPLSNVY